MKLTKDYYLFQAGAFLLAIGGRCNQLAVAWWALEKTGSAALFAALLAYTGFSEIIAKPVFGWLGDQLSRRNIVIICNIVSAFSSAALLMMAILDYFSTPLVGLLLIIFSIATGIRDPIHSSILPMLVEKNQITDAFRLKSIISSVSLLLGPGFAGLLISLFGVQATLAVDLAALLIACGMIAMITADTNPTQTVQSPASFKFYLEEWYTKTLEGFKAVVQIKTEFYLALLAMIINFALYPFFMILLPVFVKNHLGLEPWFVGVLDSSFGLGILLGSGFIVKRLNNLFGRDISVFLGFLFLGVSLFATGLIGLLANPWIILPFMVLGGVGLMLININTSVLRSLATPQSYRNRMSAMVSFLSASISPIGSYMSGIFIEHIGIISTIQTFGVTIFLTSFLIFLIPQFKAVMGLSEEAMENAYSRIYPNAFKG